MTPYTAVARGVAAGGTRDYLVLRAPAREYVALRRLTISLDQTALDHVVFECYKGTAVVGGTAVAPHRTDAYLDNTTQTGPAAASGTRKTVSAAATLIQAYGGACLTLPSATTHPSTPVLRMGYPLAWAWEWYAADGVELGLAPNEYLILHQAGTTTQATSVTVEFEVL